MTRTPAPTNTRTLADRLRNLDEPIHTTADMATIREAADLLDQYERQFASKRARPSRLPERAEGRRNEVTDQLVERAHATIVDIEQNAGDADPEAAVVVLRELIIAITDFRQLLYEAEPFVDAPAMHTVFSTSLVRRIRRALTPDSLSEPRG